MHGADQLPFDRPYLLVANHSGGGAADVMTFVSCYLTTVGADRPLTGMAHPFGFGIWPISSFMREVGAIPSTREAAEEALRSGVPVLVFPGGDHEALRPFWKAREVDFANRRGFLRLARNTGVPIVPMGITGTAYAMPVLWRSHFVLPWLLLVPRLLGLKRWGLTVLGAVGSVALALLGPRLGWPSTAFLIWLWLALPFAYVPWVPWTVRIHIGTPIEASELFEDGVEDEAQLTHAYGRVHDAVAELVRR